MLTVTGTVLYNVRVNEFEALEHDGTLPSMHYGSGGVPPVLY